MAVSLQRLARPEITDLRLRTQRRATLGTRRLRGRPFIDVTLPTGPTVQAWVYFYNAPLGQAQRITSGDYLEYIASR